MKVIYLYSDDETGWNCSHWRCHLLSNAIEAAHEENPKRFPHRAQMFFMPTAVDWDNPTVQSKIGTGDIIVCQRNVIDQKVWDMMDYWRALGKIVVTDLDDHYPNIPASNPAFAYWIENALEMDPIPVERLKKGLEHSDALISPSHVILKDWEATVPGYFWPNYPARLDYEKLPRRLPGDPDIRYGYKMRDDKPDFVMEELPNTAGNVYIGWGGSLSHVDSFKYSGVVEALARLLAERPNVYLKFCGHDERLKFLWEKLPKGKLIRQDGVDPKHWPHVVASFDIGIAPMDMREVLTNTGKENPGYSYDERRSWLKLVEYLCAGVPFVATDCAPYKELGRFGKLVANTPDAWYAALANRLDGLGYFYAEAMKNREYALKKLTVEASADRLIQLYVRVGEETQVRRLGAKLPDVLYITPAA